MKLSVKKQWGSVQCRGGWVLKVVHAHQVPTSTYDHRPDEDMREQVGMMPFVPRKFEFTWETANLDDIAIEIIAVKTGKVLGYAYLSGHAMNLIKYVDGSGPPPDWFMAGHAICFDIMPPTQDYPVEAFIGSMMRVKYGGAALAAFDLTIPDLEQLQDVAGAIARSYGYSPDDHEIEATTPLFGTVRAGNGKRKRRATLDLQPPHQKSAYACQPFFHDLLLSSPCLEKIDFFMDAVSEA